VTSSLDLLLLALASMFWPTLMVIVVLALRTAHPVKILFWFLVGGLMTTITVGIAAVFALQGSELLSGSKPPLDPALEISLGLLALLAAYLFHRRIRRTPPTPATDDDAPQTKQPSMASRAVEKGALVALLAGVVLNIVPGPLPIVALKDIAELDASNAAKVSLIIAFYMVMFAFVEVPLVAYAIAPRRTTAAVEGFNAWLSHNGQRVAVYVIAAVGLYSTLRGIARLFH
jgi:Sap-like sulfolipid-1-addressing protein